MKKYDYFINFIVCYRASGRRGAIALAWIADPKVYPIYQCSNDGLSAVGDSNCHWPFCQNFVVFFYNICQTLQADQIGSCSMTAGFSKLSTKEKSSKLKKPPNIHKKCKNRVISTISFLTKSNPLDAACHLSGTAHSVDESR